MPAPEYRRLMQRIRELATAEAGALRTIPAGRLAEELPEGLSEGDELRRTMPREDRPDGQPRIEVKPIRLRGRRHPPTGSKQIRSIEVELRVVRALPIDTIKNDDARYDELGLATEDGELLARVLELPANLERTEAGELTGCRSLVHASSDSTIRSGSKGAGAPQRLETVHRFRGWMVVDVPVEAPGGGGGGGGGGEPPAFDPLGAQLYLWAPESDTVILDAGEVTEWRNLGTAGSALDAIRVSGAVTYPGDRLTVPSGTVFESRQAATALDVADDGVLEVVAVFSSSAPNAQRFLIGGEGQTRFALIPRWSGLSVWRVFGPGTLQAIGASLANDGTVYAQRGRFVGAASPASDTSFLRTNDANGATASGDLGPVTFGTAKLALFSASASEFVGDCRAIIAKVGGFSASELAELTTRVNAAFGLALTSV